MHFTACKVSIAPLRAEANAKSEMVTQMLFGETAEVLDTQDGWQHLRCTWDGCEGWADARQLVRITPSEHAKYAQKHAMSLALMDGLMAEDHFIPVTLGASLPLFDGLKCVLGEKSYQYSASAIEPKKEERNGDFAVKLAKRYLHAPEMHGGRSPFGIDAAGLTQMVYKYLGIRLMRQEPQQVAQGRLVDFMEQCQAGDLAFFDDRKGNIGHVGLMLNDCKIIHVDGQVRMDKVDHFGIFNEEKQQYTHQLRVVKRFFKDEIGSSPSVAKRETENSILNSNQSSLF